MTQTGSRCIHARQEDPIRAADDGRQELDFSVPARLADAYRDHHVAVTAVARRVCGADHATDVTQDVFVALWSDPERFDPNRGSLRSYLLILAQHKAVDVVRRETAWLAREQRVEAATVLPPAKVDDRLLGEEVATRVRGALAGLPVSEREAIVLAFYERRSYRATAQWLETPEGTVKSRIRSGLNRLRPLLTELGDDEATRWSSSDWSAAPLTMSAAEGCAIEGPTDPVDIREAEDQDLGVERSAC